MADRAPTPSSARCPHCDHTFDPAEVTDEWCANCGRKIPEVILKDIRPKPHLRTPHPHPLPEPTAAEKADTARASRTRVFGFLLILLALLVGGGALAWIGYCRLHRTDAGSAAGWVAGAAGAALLFGAAMLIGGRVSDRDG